MQQRNSGIYTTNLWAKLADMCMWPTIADWSSRPPNYIVNKWINRQMKFNLPFLPATTTCDPSFDVLNELRAPSTLQYIVEKLLDPPPTPGWERKRETQTIFFGVGISHHFMAWIHELGLDCERSLYHFALKSSHNHIWLWSCHLRLFGEQNLGREKNYPGYYAAPPYPE